MVTLREVKWKKNTEEDIAIEEIVEKEKIQQNQKNCSMLSRSIKKLYNCSSIFKSQIIYNQRIL